ncbi:DUF4832 domain-containing protein [Chroococcidiopsis sp. CCNUC1]|jgi:hypothetical protein|uniref:DUF4832 domain-containing protein n=1 Tax=Chroococcidiopsis sp. CCNUC1 TaxID=2653189 RepID=UPI0020226C20|nr:DUF4832 domain-containing protein [Chroococcidiopsis sp. CCNUC1]URD51593.1 DUF4832 domain-containing protein [Chroococcidiopsis sp. CCNUC1]
MRIQHVVKNLKLSTALLATMAIAGSCTAAPVPRVTTTYEGSSENFSNPERGFYKSMEPLDNNPAPPLQLSELQQVRREKLSTIRRYYLLSDFRDKPISQPYLDMISNDLKTVRKAGIKMIVRFTYNWLGGGPDAPSSLMLSHLDQLKPILRANSDVIAYMEAGFIGYWGEWHHSTHNFTDHTTGKITNDAKKVALKILSVLPKNRMMVVRTLGYKKQIFDNDLPLTSEEAFNGSNRARTGHHNDAFRSTKSDWGTYSGNLEVMEQEKAWLNLDTKYVVHGGEPAGPSDPPEWDDCPGALTDFARMHWSGMTVNANGNYSVPVYQGWREQGCMNEIQQRLGYRFRLIDSAIVDKVKPAGTFSMSFRITNDGWASPYNPRSLEVILRHRETGQQYYIPVAESVRRWMPGETKTIDIVCGIPANINSGEYQVLLNLPDPAPKLYSRPEYSIRFANQNVWEPSTGYNSLLRSVNISPNVAGETYSGTQVFKLR